MDELIFIHMNFQFLDEKTPSELTDVTHEVKRLLRLLKTP